MTDQLTHAIASKIENIKMKRYENRGNAYELGMELLFQTQEDVARLESIIGQDDDAYQEIANQLATEILQCGIDYFLATKDKRSFSESNALEMLNSAKALTNHKDIINRIDENIEGIGDWVQTQEYHYNQNRRYNFDKVLLHTAFSFMTCDGHIDENEVELIKKIATEEERFGNIDINTELDGLIMGINAMGREFLKDYFKVLEHAQFNREQETQLVEMAIKTIYADNRVDYNELRFFKIFRAMLRMTDAQIKEQWPDLDDQFFERDIFSHAYLSHLFDDYFEKIELPSFELPSVSGASA